MTNNSLRLPCATCSGTGTDTHEDRHTETNRDTCRTCGGTGAIPARTGESAEASFQAPATTLGLDAPPAGGDGGLREAQTDRLGRFDHHPDPAIDFCIEVEVIEGLHYDHKVGANDGVELAQRVAKAMTFRVGGDEIAVRAKHTLREIEAALVRPDPREQAAAGVGALEAYLIRQWDWSKETFGPALRTKGVIQHITKELREIEASPHDLSEWVDVIILAMDGFWRHGGKPQDLLPAMQAKQDKNFARTWPDWRTVGEDSAIEHDRSREGTQPNQTPEAAAPSGSVGDDAEQASAIDPALYWMKKWGALMVAYDALAERAALAQQPAPQAPVADAAGVESLRRALGEPFMTATSGGSEGPFLRLKYQTLSELQAAHNALCHFFKGDPRVVAGEFTFPQPHRSQMHEVLRRLGEQAIRSQKITDHEAANAAQREALQKIERLVGIFLPALTSPQAARPGDGVERADDAMHQLWKEWLAFYNAHFRTVTGISAADQMAFYEIAQPILRGLVVPAPVQADAAEGRS